MQRTVDSSTKKKHVVGFFVLSMKVKQREVSKERARKTTFFILRDQFPVFREKKSLSKVFLCSTFAHIVTFSALVQ